MAQKFKTPAIPDWIRQLASPTNYKNPFQMGIEGPNLFGTETLCGDWDGDLLLVAQDFELASNVESVIREFGPNAAWRHNDGDSRYSMGYMTNVAICQHLTGIGRCVGIKGEEAISCRTLYVNVCFFLKIKKEKPSVDAIEKSMPVLEYVIDNMPNLKTIACLGKPAFDCVAKGSDQFKDWRTCLEEKQGLPWRGKLFFPLSHPGQQGRNNRKSSSNTCERNALIQEDWRRVGASLVRS
jgi:uracil-DNA glycosylase